MIGLKISDYLRNNGIKQKWLAEQIGITESRLSSVLNNKTTLNADMLFDICSALNVSSEKKIAKNY